MGILLLTIIGLDLKWLPPMGYKDPFTLEGIKYAILPALAASTWNLAYTTRLVRSGMIEVLGEDYVQTARAKGLPERIVIYRHALRNALLPTVTMAGITFGWMMGGIATIEYVFAYVGIGDLIINSIFLRDYPVILGYMVYMGIFFAIVNAIVDVTYSILDPRIRLR
jgi:peptide/nickel transport system permease protein